MYVSLTINGHLTVVCVLSLNSFVFTGKEIFLSPSFEIWSPNFDFDLHCQKSKLNGHGFQTLWVKIISHQNQQKLKIFLYKCTCLNTRVISG